MCLAAFTGLFGGRAQRLETIRSAEQQDRADKAMRAALTPPEDSEPARVAAERRLSRLAGRRGVRDSLGGFGDVAPQIGVRMALGE